MLDRWKTYLLLSIAISVGSWLAQFLCGGF